MTKENKEFNLEDRLIERTARNKIKVKFVIRDSAVRYSIVEERC